MSGVFFDCSLSTEAGLYLDPGLVIWLVWLASFSGDHLCQTLELLDYTQAPPCAHLVLCAAGTRTPVLTLAEQMLYLLSHFPDPQIN